MTCSSDAYMFVMFHPLVNDLSYGSFELLGPGARDLLCFQKTPDMPKKRWYYVLQGLVVQSRVKITQG